MIAIWASQQPAFSRKVFDFAPGVMPAGASLTRASSGTYWNSSGVMATALSDVARFAYDPVTLARAGLLVEPAETNEFPVSEDLSRVSWTKTNSVIATDVIAAPDGATTADRWTRSSTATAHMLFGVPKTGAALAYIARAYVKANVGGFLAARLQGTFPARTDVIFNLSTLAVVSVTDTAPFTGTSATIRALANGWIEIAILATTDTATSIITGYSFNSNGGNLTGVDSVANSSGYVWGDGLRQGTTIGSYIPTLGAAANRAADILTLNWGSKGLVDGSYTMRYTYADGSTVDVPTTVSGGTAVAATSIKPLVSIVKL